LLELRDLEQFFRLHRTLMFFVNQHLKVVPDVASAEAFSHLSPELRLKVRDAFLKNTDLIQQFVDENPAHLSGDELDIVRSWRHLIHGKFYVYRELKKYTVFLSTTDPTIAWPEERLLQPAGQIIITSRSSNEDHWQQQVFDPTLVAAGVELSDDPILAFRGHAYAVSAQRRQRQTKPVSEPH